MAGAVNKAVGHEVISNEERQRRAEQARANAAAQAQINTNSAQSINGGTNWEQNQGEFNAQYNSNGPMVDERSYMYGRAPGAADAAVADANATGDAAYNTGKAIFVNDARYAQAAQNRVAPQGQFGEQNAALGQSLGYGQQLAGLEAQQGPSAAQAQLQQGTNQAISSQLALARSGRGFGGGAASAGLAQSNLAGLQANQSNQAAMLRAQEDAAWRGRQATNYGNAAAISQGAGNQYGQQSQANLQANLQSTAQNDQAALGYLGQGATAYGNGVTGSFDGQNIANQIRGQEMQGGENLDERNLRAWSAQQGFTLAQNQADAQEQAAVLGGVATVGAAIATKSDVRSKTDIVPMQNAESFARPNLQQPDTAALDAAAQAPGYSYRYKDPDAPGAAPGQHFGPMAQDLARTPVGASTVVKGKDGKLGVDTGRLSLVNTSAISAQQSQLDEIRRQIAAFSASPVASYPMAAPASAAGAFPAQPRAYAYSGTQGLPSRGAY
jgi:hypothetical protein